jgi:MFS family permease
MTGPQDSYPSYSKDGFLKRAVKNIDFRPYITGRVPLFILAHFGHHGVGAMLNPLTPMIRNSLNLSYTQIGFMRTAFGLTAGLSQLPAGLIADRIGVRIMVLLGVTGVAIAGFFLGFTQSFTWLLGFLILSSILGAGYHPASVAAISTSVKEEYRGRALGFHLVGGSSAFWIFPLIAAPIAGKWGWQAPFLAISIPMAILGIVLYFVIGKRSGVETGKQQEEENDVEVPEEKGSIQWGNIVPFLIISVVTGTMVQSVSAYLSLYATDVLNVSEVFAARIMSITPAMGLFAAPIGGYFADRFGSMRIILIVAFLSVPLIYLIGNAPNVGVLITLMVVMGLITNTRMPTSESYLASNTPANRRATVMGIYYFSGTGVSAPLSPVIGNLIERIGFSRTFSYTSAATGLIAVVCSLFLWRYRRYNKYPEISGK